MLHTPLLLFCEANLCDFIVRKQATSILGSVDDLCGKGIA